MYAWKNTHVKRNYLIHSEMWDDIGNIHAPKAVTYHEQSHYCRFITPKAVTYHEQSHCCRFIIGHNRGRMGGQWRSTFVLQRDKGAVRSRGFPFVVRVPASGAVRFWGAHVDVASRRRCGIPARGRGVVEPACGRQCVPLFSQDPNHRHICVLLPHTRMFLTGKQVVWCYERLMGDEQSNTRQTVHVPYHSA